MAFYQASLPEGFLLSVLKEQLGPHLGASPLDLLAVVGHNMVDRVQVPDFVDAAVDCPTSITRLMAVPAPVPSAVAA